MEERERPGSGEERGGLREAGRGGGGEGRLSGEGEEVEQGRGSL